ncbi:unnamed protein product [Pylaiella littoralis]
MIKRNTSLNRVEGLAEQSSSRAPLSRRRSPVAQAQHQHFVSIDQIDTPPSSPRRARSLSPSSRRAGVGSVKKGRQGWPRGDNSENWWFSFRTVFLGMFPRSQAGVGGGGAEQGVERGVGDNDASGKGPKSFFRLRTLHCRKLVALLAVGLCVLAGGRRLVGASRNQEGGGGTPKLRGLNRRHRVGEVLSSLETHYCSAPLDYPLAQRPSQIGDNGDAGGGTAGAIAGGLELRQLQVTIRHGDRSAIHELPNAYEQKWKCQPFSEEIQQKWEGVSRFSVKNVDGRPLARSLTPAVYAKEELGQLGKEFKGRADVLCKQGQLTETGIRQHLTLGEHMHQAYHGLLGGDLATEEVYVRSTDYTRTLESAAAFLMSFFPGSSEMTIITDEDEKAEVMHGIGLKAIDSEHGAKGPEKGVVGACDRAARLTQAQVQQFKPRADVVEDLHGLFGEDVSELKMTSMADSMHALSCHNMTLPCSDKGCVSPKLALSVLSEADRQMCMKYNGAAGGGEASTLSLYPFTLEILTNMRQALNGEIATKFALFSGHDTVVAPLLAALGAYDCRWPPYASHVAFELWSKPPSSGSGDGDGDGDGEEPPRRVLLEDGGDATADADAAAAGTEGDVLKGGNAHAEEEVVDARAPPIEELSAGEGTPAGEKLILGSGGGVGAESAERGAAAVGVKHEGQEEAFVRVTFQGQPVTHRITDCSKDPLEGPYGREFCPLSLFAKTIARALGPYDTLEEACKAVDV